MGKLTLTTPEAIDETVTYYELTSFTFDYNQSLVYIVYDKQNSSGTVIEHDASHTLQPAEVGSVLAYAKTLVQGGMNVNLALQRAFTEELAEGTYS
jgi:hypothetical protein